MSFVETDGGNRTVSDSESILPDYPPIDEHTSQNNESHSEMKPPGSSGVENMDDRALDVDIKEEDSEIILPDFPSIDEHTSQNDEIHSEMRPPGQIGIENMNDSALDVDIKEEGGKLFMGRSIDEENDETVFPFGLILVHHQKTMIVTASDRRTERHSFTCTPVYMNERGTPSFLETSTPNRSIIQTPNSEVKFVQQRIQPRSAASAPLSSRLYSSRNLMPQDPLKITTPDKTPSFPRVKFILPSSNISMSNHEVDKRQEINETPEERNARLGVELERQRKHLANETSVQINKRLEAMAEYRRKRLASETPDQRAKRLADRAERQRQHRINQTLEQKTCKECGKSMSSSAALQRHMGIHNKRYQCEEPGCRKSYASRPALKIHMGIHIGHKRFDCEEPGCRQSYASLPRLKAHMVIHSGCHIECCKCCNCKKRCADGNCLRLGHLCVH